MTRSLLVEIGTEEIPSGFIPTALSFMQGWMDLKLGELLLDHTMPETFGTPRRLAIKIDAIPEKLPDIKETKTGPPKMIAFDEQGSPTQAAFGFAKTVGVDIKDITFKDTPKGPYLCVTRTIPGRPAGEVFPSIIEEMIKEIPFQKTMRWPNPGVRFARPVHWIVALFGDTVLDVAFGDISAGNKTKGNRFMAPGFVEMPGPEVYEKVLKEAYVIPDIEARKAMIWEDASRFASQIEGQVRDKDLLDEVVNLLEYPYVIMGKFGNGFLELPTEVLVTVMRHHQRCFPVYHIKDKTNLKPYFIGVSNIIPRDTDLVRKGNERVLKARLEDAEYFFKEDLKVPLEEYAKRLEHVVFHKGLGTSYEKVLRFTHIALYLAEYLAPDKTDKVKQAAMFCKGDLNSLMVYEFPELQGVMGREYALRQGYDPEVALAIHEHYLPAFATDGIPSDIIGALVGLADRIDTICGCFGIGEIPTGTSDPYGLRRQAMGILNILLDKAYRISITELIDLSLSLLSDKIKRPGNKVRQDILEFFKTRIITILQSKDIGGDIIEACLSSGFDDPVDAYMRAKAITSAIKESWFESICIASKRVENILKSTEASGDVSPDLLVQDEEKTLHNKFQEIERPFISYAGKGEYTSALRLLANLKGPIDAFFDGVLVMTDDIPTRNNRIILLKRLVGMFNTIAKFSCINTR
ncbi:MAG: glycine--tRNA ligase subunit beta [Thermodesulfobacteriota bacterium]|nr:glycine--tRNA ligase subunit beta [Thermodesulfobacteriota bacterium]